MAEQREQGPRRADQGSRRSGFSRSDAADLDRAVRLYWERRPRPVVERARDGVRER